MNDDKYVIIGMIFLFTPLAIVFVADLPQSKIIALLAGAGILLGLQVIINARKIKKLEGC